MISGIMSFLLGNEEPPLLLSWVTPDQLCLPSTDYVIVVLLYIFQTQRIRNSWMHRVTVIDIWHIQCRSTENEEETHFRKVLDECILVFLNGIQFPLQNFFELHAPKTMSYQFNKLKIKYINKSTQISLHHADLISTILSNDLIKTSVLKHLRLV